MKAVSELISTDQSPRLIPSFKQTERRLLSIFMAVLETVPEYRSEFFKRCEYNSGLSCTYSSYMEPEFKLDQVKVRPDGLIVCSRGSKTWSAFIEAKSEGSNIRPEQIQDYADLASKLDVDAIITISNEFASDPSELPYNIAHGKRKKRRIYHFAWSELRSSMEIFRENDTKCQRAEKDILRHSLAYFWEKTSGIDTFDLMPPDWKKFVESSGVGVGYGTKTQGITEIVQAWQQEKRDLCAKLIFQTERNVELRHGAGARATPEERLKYDRKDLADNYRLTANYQFKESKSQLRILASLSSCKIGVALEITPPTGKGARACVTWLEQQIRKADISNIKISFDWRGHSRDTTCDLKQLFENPEIIYEGQKDGPKSIRIIREIHDVRRFKSRARFIEDLEENTIFLAKSFADSGIL